MLGSRSLPVACVLAVFGAAPAQAEEPSAVASFPDVPPDAESTVRPEAPRPASRRPTEAPASAAQDLDVDPYDEQLLLVNPYGDEAAFVNPYSEELVLADPYADQLRLLTSLDDDGDIANPYSSFLAGPMPARGSSAPATGLLALSVTPGFRGAVFVDRVRVPAVTASFSVLPGAHVVVVYPSASAPYRSRVVVHPGEATPLGIRSPLSR